MLCVPCTGVEVVSKKPGSLIAFDGAFNNVQHLVLTANVRGLDPLLPYFNDSGPGVWGPKKQQHLFYIYGLVNLTMENSAIQGLAPLTATFPGDSTGPNLNPAVPHLRPGETEEETAARRAKWTSYVRVQNCTFSNTHLDLEGHPEGLGALTKPIVEASGRVCMLSLGALYSVFWPGHVEVLNTTFHNIITSAPPGSGLRLHMLCADTGDDSDTVTVRDSTFSNIRDTQGDSLDVFHTSMVYTGRSVSKSFTLQRFRFEKITAALLAALEVQEVKVDNCSVNSAQLAYGGFAVMVQSAPQMAEIMNSTFSNIQLGAAHDATALNQDYYTPGVGLLKTGPRASAHVQGCMFRNISLLRGTGSQGRSPNESQQSPYGGAVFTRTAVIAAGADARMAQATFEDCFTPAVVYAFSGEKETFGRVYSSGTANRGPRSPFVSLVLDKSTFKRNMYGVYADGFQMIVSNCSLTASIVSGMRVSGVPCLVVNGTKLHGASISVQRANNPGGTAFSFCRSGRFPLWLNDRVGGAELDVPVVAGSAAAPHSISERLTDTFDSAVSVHFESVRISGVHGQAALSLRDVHKASLQRVNLVGNVGRSALKASSVVGLLMLQCNVVDNSVELSARALDLAGGGTFKFVQNLYLLATVFAGNIGPEAGWMLLQSCGHLVINSCTYHNNTASRNGGAVRAITSESVTVDTSTLQQPENISCMPAGVSDLMFDQDFRLDLSAIDERSVVCPTVLLGGRATTFSSNVAGASGGAVAIEGLTLAAFNATQVNFLGNR